MDERSGNLLGDRSGSDVTGQARLGLAEIDRLLKTACDVGQLDVFGGQDTEQHLADELLDGSLQTGRQLGAEPCNLVSDNNGQSSIIGHEILLRFWGKSFPIFPLPE